MKKHKRSTFSGKLGFVLSAAGASVGLGNIWRFPYLAAKYGGGIFLLVYIILALTFGYTFDHGGDFSWTHDKKKALLEHLKALETHVLYLLVVGSMQSFRSSSFLIIL